QRPTEPVKPLVLVKHSTLTVRPGSARLTYIFSGQPGTPLLFSGPLLMAGSRDGEVLSVRAGQRHVARVYSLRDGSEHGKVEFQPPDINAPLALAGAGRTLVNMAMSGTNLYELNGADMVRRDIFLFGPLQELGHGEWQGLEAEPGTLRSMKLHRFR